jgi:hypothetical protein
MTARIVNRAQPRADTGTREACRAVAKGKPCTSAARWTLTLDDGTSINVCRLHTNAGERRGTLEVWARAAVQLEMGKTQAVQVGMDKHPRRSPSQDHRARDGWQMNGIRECDACDGDGFVYERCGCREADCPHEPRFMDDGTEPVEGLYRKFWVRRTDGGSRDGEKHEDCDYFVLDWAHDPFAIPAALAYATACEAKYPELAANIRAQAKKAGAR